MRLIEDGLSYATDDAPRVYTLAWEESTEGVHSELCLGLLQQASLSPWELKRAFTDQLDDPDASVSAEWSNVNDDVCVCLVNNSLKRLNEASVFVLQSHIECAGLGLFLQPTPPSGRPLVIPDGKYIRIYSRRPTSQQVNDMESMDYVMKIGSNRLCCDAEMFTGVEMGRFVNQGGL